MKTKFIFVGAASVALFTASLATRVDAEPKRPIVIREFTYPWSDKPAPRTECRISTTHEGLIFLFDVEDRDIVVSKAWIDESTMNGQDRVEIFIAPHEDLSQYYCFEVDPLGRVHDYSAKHYRQFDSGWNCPGLVLSAHRTAEGYSVEGLIPWASLDKMLGRSVRSGQEVRVGLFRAEFYGSEPSTHGEANHNWISWIKPDSPTPDFHVPSAFRNLKLP